MPLLTELLSAASDSLDISQNIETVVIDNVTCDSRKVHEGSLFVALKGEKMDATQFAAQAVSDGAVAVLCADDAVIDVAVPVIKSANPRRSLAQIAAAFYGKQPAHMVGITGTDGKTSTADFYRQFMHLMGWESASIGTLGVLSGENELLYPGTHTTPDPVVLHEWLAGMNADYVSVEVSSHGLDQHRMDGVKLEAAAFTNFARDHLDYHKTEEAYFTAKARLFSALLPEGGTAVLNQDDGRFAELSAICKERGHRIIGVGKNGSEFTLEKLELLPHGQRATLNLLGKNYTIDVPLVGAFQTMNILAALGLVVGTGGDVEAALAVVPKLAGVPGRLEQVAQLDCGASVFIDYAHTPMALANILNTVRPHTQNKLHVVFGCGGDRDAGKRPEMGKIAAEFADHVVVTDDNPRSEDPALIRAAIMAAAAGAKEVADRKEAIYVALGQLRAGDVLVIAGKGHEKTQTIGDQVIAFDDAEIARTGVKELRLTA